MNRVFSAAAMVLFLLANVAAQGGGSIGLDDLLEAVKTDLKLTAEIQDELKKNGLKVEGINCTGFRHGNAWRELGGTRAAPYECEIGKRTVFIEADRRYFDARKRPLGDMKKANRKRADSFTETNFRWTWKAKE